jgi:RNA-directed DNA polymerase
MVEISLSGSGEGLGWATGRCFGYIKDWVEKKVRRHLMRARGLRGFGWDRWSRGWLHEHLGLFDGYRVSRPPKELPTG